MVSAMRKEMMGDDGWGEIMMGGGAMMIVFPLVFVALVIGSVWLIGRAVGSGRPSGDSTGSDSALRILEERYARGEIDGDEFHQRRNVLRR